MRILFTTQSNSLRMFEALWAELHATVGIDAAGFTVADSFMFERWLVERPDFEHQGHLLLKEWEVTGNRSRKPSFEKLERWEQELGGKAGLFGAIVADRRLIMGPDCTYSQDYRRRFTDDELLCILQGGVEGVERLFDKVKPDLVVGFICATMIEYLVYLVAKARGIRTFNIRPTRIGDRVTLSSTLNDPDPDFVAAYERALEMGSPKLEEAKDYIRRVRETHGRYEGAIRPSDRPALVLNQQRHPPWKVAFRVWKNWRAYRTGLARHDNHVPNPLRSLFFAAVNPLRARRTRRQLQEFTVRPKDQKNRYAFYPLHTEPEVSLLVYGRPFVNQIEVMRAVAMSLPADMTLIVKEHPWMVGKRSNGAYKKMLEIPKLRFAPPGIDARELIRGAELVAVVTGSIALEAALLGKPVITFGDCPYNVLPDSLVQRCADLRHLPQQIRSTLSQEAKGSSLDHALETYVASAFETSVSINLYSVLLQKKNVHSERCASFAEEVKKLADHLLDKYANPLSIPAAKSRDVARW